MFRHLCVSLAIGGALFFAASSAMGGPARDACGALAASPWQSGFAETGLELYEIDSGPALVACREAMVDEPQSLDAVYWTARALVADRQALEAKRLLETGAGAAHVPSMHLLGRLLQDDKKASADDIQRSAQLLEAAAGAGFVPAISDYGYALEIGRGAPADPAAALASYQTAAEAGYPPAFSMLGFAHVYGVGTAEDAGASTRWFERAAAAGEPSGMANLAYNYMEGYGVEEDDPRAMALFEQALELNLPVAATNLGWMHESGQGVPRDQKRAAQYYQRGADLGESKAMNNLARMYLHGRGVEADGSKAVQLAEAALDLGEMAAYSTLGDAFIAGGPAITPDTKRGMEYLEAGVAAGDLSSMVSLGHWLVEGDDAAQYGRAFNLTLAAANGGDAQAMGNLAYHYMEGAGVAPDLAAAVKWATRGVELGNPTAQGNLGELYERGVGGLEKDLVKALELYELALAQGEDWVAENISRMIAGRAPPPLPMHKRP